MMATIVEQIYAYARRIMSSKLGPAEADLVKKRVIDSIFVSYGARNAAPVEIAKKSLLPSSGKYNAPIYFTKQEASVDVAAFINGVMTRYLDYNDTYLTKREFAHPSDNIPALMTLAEAIGAPGSKLLNAIYVAYQVQCSLADAASLRDRGWDHVVYLSVSSAAGAAALLGLDKSRFCNALNLGINNNIAMRQVRAGELSMWKGCTAANACRNSIFASLLALEGMTGPSPIFEGEMGFFNEVTGKFKVNLLPDRVANTLIKNHPVEYNAMSAVDAALELRQKVHGRINGISVDTASVIYRTIVKDPEKLHPTTRETADHSLPYIIAYTLLYGAPTPDSYDNKFLSDRKILGLMGKMKLGVKKEFNPMYPDYVPSRIAVSTDEGKVFTAEVMVPKGHYRMPYSWDDLRAKGIKLLGSDYLVDEIMSAGRALERRGSTKIFELMANVDIEGQR